MESEFWPRLRTLCGADGVSIGTLSVSALAWLWLFGSATRGVQSFCLSGDGLQWLAAGFDAASASGLLLTEAWHWILMVIAMMSPLLGPPIRHVIARSYRWRRRRAIMGFLLGYGAGWAFAGIGAIALLVSLAVSGYTTRPITGAVALLLAAAWHFLPIRGVALRLCHRTMALAPRGWAADRDCLRYGAVQGLTCLGSCLPAMLATMLAFPGVLAPALVAIWLYVERGYQRNYRIVATALLSATALAQMVSAQF